MSMSFVANIFIFSVLDSTAFSNFLFLAKLKMTSGQVY